jgi:hypothetical protein
METARFTQRAWRWMRNEERREVRAPAHQRR